MSPRNGFNAFCVAAVVTCYGCDQQPPPTTPTATVPRAPATTLQQQPLHVVGRIVDSTNNPVTGARVTQWDTSNTTVSDASGAFEMTAVITAQDRTFWVTVEKPGFESSELNRSVDAATNTSLRLHQIRNIAAGESFRAVVNPDDSACGYHWGFVCRRVRVTPESSGTLTLEVVSSGELGMPIGPVGFPQTLERHTSVPVKAGSPVFVDIAAGWPVSPSAEFTLDTSLTPAS
jgi:carboxypeptidase family protein